jgi:hypothetical protein
MFLKYMFYIGLTEMLRKLYRSEALEKDINAFTDKHRLDVQCLHLTFAVGFAGKKEGKILSN